MFARKLLTGLLTGGLAVSVIGLTAGSASAAYQADPDDVLPAAAADLIGVGSDTTQGVLAVAARTYNATNPAVKLATYAATGGGSITPPGSAEIPTRPNGSGAGKGLLYGSANNVAIDFARSSSAQNTAETTAGLQSFPFALDTLVTVTAPNSNAPATLTRAQLLDIYEGTTTNWNQIGGANGIIKPLVPQTGSGTGTFFKGQLDAENGSAITYGTAVGTFQENDDTLIKNDPNAIAPFSVGRAGLLGTLRVEGGFTANRAVYNVVRGTDLAAPGVQALFGSAGYLCSPAATGLIEDSGFKQLATPARGGVCGANTQSASTNFITNERLDTTTALAGTSPGAGVARLTAAITSSSAPQGTVAFFEGATQLATNVPLVSGQALLQLTTTPGAHTYTARFTPAGGSVFRRSTSTAVTVNVASPAAVRAAAKISESFPGKAKTVTKKGKLTVKPLKGKVSVAGGATAPTGVVVVKRGSKTVGTASLAGGVATFTIKKGLKPGKNKLSATYAGDSATNGAAVSFTVKVAKPKKKK